jgi:polyisoprenoid-binding protein YceI
MKQIATSLLVVSLLIGVATPGLAGSYTIDKSHSSVEFKVKHMAISKVRGSFDDFTATFTFEPDKPETWQVRATIQAASINTANEDRDNHLRSADFFEVEKFPTIEFVSTGVKKLEGNETKLMGDLTIHGVTKAVVLELEFNGTVVDPWGNSRAGFSARGKINRKDFGLTWHKVLETGGLMVGDDVEITIDVEGILDK